MGDITDLFDTETPEVPVTIQLPPEKKFDNLGKVGKDVTPEPAFTIVSKKRITAAEHKLITAILDKISAAKKQYGIESEIVEDLSSLKKAALEVLGSNFNIATVGQLKKENLNFNVKDNYEVELLRRRRERGTN